MKWLFVGVEGEASGRGFLRVRERSRLARILVAALFDVIGRLFTEYSKNWLLRYGLYKGVAGAGQPPPPSSASVLHSYGEYINLVEVALREVLKQSSYLSSVLTLLSRRL